MSNIINQLRDRAVLMLRNMAWLAQMTVTSAFGWRRITVNGVVQEGIHSGIDLVARPNNRNERVVACEAGTVVSVRRRGRQFGDGCFVRLRHDNGMQSLYFHQADNTIPANIVPGARVQKGQDLGMIGTTGNSTGVHLHFQIDRGGSATAIDPRPYLEGRANPFSTTPTPPSSNIDTIAREVIQGRWGNGADRVNRLTAAGHNASQVQARVNEILRGNNTPNNNNLEAVARRVIRGEFGNGAERVRRLTAAGYNASEVQRIVNQLLR